MVTPEGRPEDGGDAYGGYFVCAIVHRRVYNASVPFDAQQR